MKVSSPNVTDSLKKLLNKEVDFILTDSIVARSMKQDLPQDVKNQLVIYNKVVLANKLFFAIRKNYPDAKTIIEKFNQSIRNMISDGSYNRILGFEWLVADTDGDGVEEYIVGDLAPSTTADPASSDDSYPVFSKQENTDKKRPKKYRVLNLEYNSWNEAEQAIQKARISGSLQYEDKETGAVNIFSGKF